MSLSHVSFPFIRTNVRSSEDNYGFFLLSYNTSSLPVSFLDTLNKNTFKWIHKNMKITYKIRFIIKGLTELLKYF